jgi:hypothetical protein
MEATVNIKTEALKNGLIWGVINIVIFLASWYLVPELMGSFWYNGITILIGLGLAIFFCIDMRKKVGGYWSFSQALWPIFVTFISAMAIVFVFSILFGKYIDTSYPEKMKEMIMAKTENTYNSLGLDKDKTAEVMRDTSKNLDKQFTPTFNQAIVGFGISSVFYFIGALIFALIFKRNNPNPFGAPADQHFGTN